MQSSPPPERLDVPGIYLSVPSVLLARPPVASNARTGYSTVAF